jgi:hypothetical protein
MGKIRADGEDHSDELSHSDPGRIELSVTLPVLFSMASNK